MTSPLRVLLCDDHAIMRSGLRRILADADDIEVVADAGTAGEAVEMVLAQMPDVLVVDLSMPEASGISAIERIRAVTDSVHVLVLTMHEDVAYLRQAFAAGASGYLVKAAADAELLRAVRVVARGERYVDPVMGAALVADDDAPANAAEEAVHTLSEREKEILRLIALGYTNPEMGTSLHLSVRTVETYRARMQHKLGLRSRADLARLARDAGIVG